MFGEIPIGEGLQVIGLGLVGVFAALGLVAGCVVVLAKVVGHFEAREAARAKAEEDSKSTEKKE